MKGLGEVMVPLGFLCFMGGLLLGAYEVVFWLKTGLWPHLTLASPFGSYIPRDWSGASQVIFWIWEQSLWGCRVRRQHRHDASGIWALKRLSHSRVPLVLLLKGEALADCLTAPINPL